MPAMICRIVVANIPVGNGSSFAGFGGVCCMDCAH